MVTRWVVLAASVALLATGCNGDANNHDLKGVPFTHPDSITVWDNIDEHPNVARLCLDGVAFATTSREAQAALQRIPDWDKYCPAAKSPVLSPK